MPARRPSELLDKIEKENQARLATLEAQQQQSNLTKSLSGFTRDLGYENKPFHDEWYSLAEEGATFLLLAPRGHAKSTAMAVNYVLYRILRDPNVRVLIVSNTVEQARKWVGELKLNIEQKFPWLKGAPWGRSEFTVPRTTILKDPTVRATGIQGPIIGARLNLIICDDVVDEENSKSELQRQSVSNSFKKVLHPTLEPNGQIIVVGTPWHYADLYAQLEREGWEVHRYRAIQSNGSALWPERYPLSCGRENGEVNCCLQHIRESLGTPIFNDQYLCDPSGLVGRLMRLEWLEPFYNEENIPRQSGLELVMGVDVAISQKQTADYTAIAVVGYSATTKTMYLLNIWRGQIDFPTQLSSIQREFAVWKPSRIIVEANAYQVVLSQALKQATLLPVHPRTTIKDKVTRIQALTPYFESKRIMVRRDQHEFISEYLQFPDGEHDDMLDATELACRDIIDRTTQRHTWMGTGGVLKFHNTDFSKWRPKPFY